MNYKIQQDLILIRDYMNITQEKLASILNVERVRIARIESGSNYPRDDFLEEFYGSIFKNNIHLNIQKEMFYKEEIDKHHILLSHASKSGISGNIDINYSRENNDFGKGFYCGCSYEKSVSFVSKFEKSCTYFIDFDPTDLSKIEFEVNNEWMITIAYFRKRLEKYKNNHIIKNIINKINKSDYIIAPIADNRMFQIIDMFIDGYITDEQCKHCLAATNLGKQYVFLTSKSLNNLHIIERCYISNKEKMHYKKMHQETLSLGNEKVKLSLINYKGKGKYIEEIMNE